MAASIQAYLDNLYTAKLIRSVHSKNQLEEALADFWFNHFNVNINDNFVRYSIQSYERDAIRPNAMGKFETLLRATAEHPAMLYYLDNYLSQAARTAPRRLHLPRAATMKYVPAWSNEPRPRQP